MDFQNKYGEKETQKKLDRLTAESAPRRRKKLVLGLRGIFLVLVTAGGIGICLGAGVYGKIAADTPDVSEISIGPGKYASLVYDAEGNTIEQINEAQSNRIHVSIEEIPEDMQHAMVAIEDSRFYSHHGVDFQGILRAAAVTVASGFRQTEGASTITQQLIKNNVFTDWTDENFLESLRRKIQEQQLAVELEAYLTEQGLDAKSVILEEYLNTVNFGAGAYGVEMAAQTYFGKESRELTLSECGVLAAIPQNPTKWDPRQTPQGNAGRRETVLYYMRDQEWITQEELEEALDDDVYSRITEKAKVQEKGSPYSYFIDELLSRVQEDLIEKKGYTETQAANAVYSGGLKIYSTQDTWIQEIMEEEFADESNYPAWVSQSEDSLSQPQAAMVVLEQRTGYVKGIIGGCGEKQGSLTLNRASDTYRQPGSAFKILAAYGPALDEGEITLADHLEDEEYFYEDGTLLRNADNTYHGSVSVRQAIQNSYNVPAVKVLTEITPEKGFSYLQELGFSRLDEDRDVIQPLALGGITNGVSVLELTAAYGAVADGGIYREPVFYTEVTDQEGNVLLRNEPEGRRVFKESTAFLLTSAMEDVVSQGTGTGFRLEDMHTAGKTGTANDYRDLTFAGYTPYYTAAIWAGYDNSQNLPEGQRTFHRTLWRNVMNRIHEDLPDKAFEQPSTVDKVTICEDSGLLAGKGCTRIKEYFDEENVPKKTCTQHKPSLFPKWNQGDEDSGEEEENSSEKNQEGGLKSWLDSWLNWWNR